MPEKVSCSTILLAIVVLAFFYFTGRASADSDSCFPHESLYTITPIDIRSDDSYLARNLGKTTRHKTYKVLESRKAALFGSCWIKISDGWLLSRANASAIKPGISNRQPARSTSTTPSSNTVSKCYTGSKAYITGAMNIRSGPSTSNGKVGSANSGESFTVSQSQRGGDYCWLKISKGWIAKTARVRSTKPPPYSPSSTNTSRLPRIDGDASFRAQIIRAFNYLRDRAPNWFNYVVAKISSVEPYWGRGALVESNSGLLLINSSIFSNSMQRASVLVHEACHVYQRHAGRSESLGHEGREWECTQKQIDFVKQVEPGASTWLRTLRRYQQHPY